MGGGPSRPVPGEFHQVNRHNNAYYDPTYGFVQMESGVDYPYSSSSDYNKPAGYTQPGVTADPAYLATPQPYGYPQAVPAGLAMNTPRLVPAAYQQVPGAYQQYPVPVMLRQQAMATGMGAGLLPPTMY
jgi:hypothetical protein